MSVLRRCVGATLVVARRVGSENFSPVVGIRCHRGYARVAVGKDHI